MSAYKVSAAELVCPLHDERRKETADIADWLFGYDAVRTDQA